MEAKKFFKGNAFKSIVALLCVLLVSGLFLCTAYGFLEVTAGEKLQRAIKGIYGTSVQVYGKDDAEITAEDTDPKGLIEKKVTVGNAEILQMYKIVFGKDESSETDYLVQSKGKGGYGGGSVTCWVALTYDQSGITGIRNVQIADNSGQSFIGKITDGFLKSFSTGYEEGVEHFTTGDGYVSSGASLSSAAICNAVNGAVTYVKEEVFGNVTENKFNNFEFMYIYNTNNEQVQLIDTVASDYAVDGNTVTYSLITCGNGRAGSFELDIVVEGDGETGTVKTFTIIENGSTGPNWANKVEQSVASYQNKGLDFFKNILGDDLRYSDFTPDGTNVQTGASHSNFICLCAGAFATANYKNGLDYNLSQGGTN